MSDSVPFEVCGECLRLTAGLCRLVQRCSIAAMRAGVPAHEFIAPVKPLPEWFDWYADRDPGVRSGRERMVC
jgi:hypothetical protein